MKKVKPKFIYDKKNRKIGIALSNFEYEKFMDVFDDWEDYSFLLKYKPVSLEKCIPMEKVFSKLNKNR